MIMTPDDNQYLNKYNENPSDSPDRIMVLGVGGGGSNAVNYMYKENMIKGVAFVVANTDRQALNSSPVPRKLLLGPSVTRGLGAGADPEVGRDAAEESAGDADALFTEDTDMVFITAGMGGGTGTGAAPVIARIARDRGILTIGIVTIPFIFEGMKKITKALAGADELRKHVDALMVINNERLTEIYPDLDFDSAFAKADDTLSIAAQSISEIVTDEGRINLDQRDVNTTLRDGGTAIISIGYGEGENRVAEALENAIYSPLLKNTDVYSSKRLLFNITFNPKSTRPFKMSETKDLKSFVNKMHAHVDVIYGTSNDETLGEKIKITLLASGFDMTVNEDSDRGPIVVEGKNDDNQKEINTRQIADVYGGDLINDIIREREAQNYVLFSKDTLDDERMIAEFESTPTCLRKRPGPRNASTPASPATSQSNGSLAGLDSSAASPSRAGANSSAGNAGTNSRTADIDDNRNSDSNSRQIRFSADQDDPFLLG